MTGHPRLHLLLCIGLLTWLAGCSGEVSLGNGDDAADATDATSQGDAASTNPDTSVTPAPDATNDTVSAMDLVDTASGTDTTAPPAPDTTGPDTTQPDVVEPDTVEPDTTEPDTTEPDTVEPDTTEPEPGGLCSGPCNDHAQCGGANDLCLVNNNTGESFCGQYCASAADCPGGFSCASVGGYPQCVPDSQTCQGFEPPVPCDPACGAGQVCVDGMCVEGGMWEVELQLCVDEINSYRIDGGLAPLQRSAALEDCAAQGAYEDSQSGQPHGHFQATQGCGLTARAENEIPGWQGGASAVAGYIQQGTLQMFNEGPGGGHHDNIMNPSSTAVGCGIYVTDTGAVWIVQDFR